MSWAILGRVGKTLLKAFLTDAAFDYGQELINGVGEAKNAATIAQAVSLVRAKDPSLLTDGKITGPELYKFMKEHPEDAANIAQVMATGKMEPDGFVKRNFKKTWNWIMPQMMALSSEKELTEEDIKAAVAAAAGTAQPSAAPLASAPVAPTSEGMNKNGLSRLRVVAATFRELERASGLADGEFLTAVVTLLRTIDECGKPTRDDLRIVIGAR